AHRRGREPGRRWRHTALAHRRQRRHQRDRPRTVDRGPAPSPVERTHRAPVLPAGVAMSSAPRSGFTMVELLVVVATILVLLGLGIPIYGLVVARSRTGATAQLVAGFSAAVARTGQLTVTLGTAAAPQLRIMYDFDRNGLLD